MRNTFLSKTILLGAMLFLIFSTDSLGQTQPQSRQEKNKLNLSVNLPSREKSCLNLGLISHIRQLRGAGINVLTSSVRDNCYGLQLSGLISTAQNDMKGLQISGLANFTERNAYGTAISSFFNVTGGTLYGLQISLLGNISKKSTGFSLSGLSNLTGKSGKGFHLSGLANISGADQHGLFACGLMNVAARQMKGAQLSGIMNVSGYLGKGAQVAGISNVAVQMTGLQLAGATNVCQGRMKGLQLGCSNIADEVKGAQVGFINICGGNVEGCQIGIINQSKDTTAHKVGLVNITPKTDIKFLFFAGNVSKFNFATQFKNQHTYTILGFGTHYLDLSKKFSGCIYYRAGLLHKLAPKWEISGDLGYFHIENFKNEDVDTPECMYSLQGRVNLDFSFSKRMGVFASGGYSVTRHYHKDKTYEKKPVFEIGIHIL